MNLDEMIKLIQAVSNSSLSKFDLEEGNLKLSMITDKMPAPVLQTIVSSGQRGSEGGGLQVNPMTAQPVFASVNTGAAEGEIHAMAAGNGIVSAAGSGVTTGSNPAADEAGGDGAIASDHIVKSPLVGTFYNASSPDAEPFAKVGDTVKKGQVLGIIEAMKLMNEIESDFDGVVEAVMVDNEQVVEYGQPLFRIR